jgi:hypothetical protein
MKNRVNDVLFNAVPLPFTCNKSVPIYGTVGSKVAIRVALLAWLTPPYRRRQNTSLKLRQTSTRQNGVFSVTAVRT